MCILHIFLMYKRKVFYVLLNLSKFYIGHSLLSLKIVRNKHVLNFFWLLTSILRYLMGMSCLSRIRVT